MIQEPMARLKRSIDANREISRWQLPRGVGSQIRLLQYMHNMFTYTVKSKYSSNLYKRVNCLNILLHLYTHI